MEQEYIIGGAVVVALLLVVVWFALFRKAGGKVGEKVVFMGLPSCGKSALYWKLLHGQEVETQTSAMPNMETKELGTKAKKTKTVVDYPGHYRLRPGLSALCEDACQLVFVIDAIDWETSLSSNAELLVTTLTNPKIVLKSTRPAMSIVCTKRDVGHSYKSTAIKRQLEKEIEKVRKTKTNVVNQLGTEGADIVELGIDDEKFNFEAHCPLPVTFFDVASKGDHEGVDELRAWMNENV
eukprot:TRINITY_DN5835_c0_g1_i1.p1 TRINITY_DN5835_c0_g1~~TRINITY_DN5835_c0_g1_i1.p1  ORF type:complete len:238 (+),score=64.19 TRINITY_DN5835_c0_g1_i1:60-773(+)